MLWGGYDAVYNFRNGMGPHLDERPATFELLAGQFFETFPQLEGLRFTPPLGRRDRHLLALLGDVRQGARRARGLRRGLHRPGRGRQPLRRPGGARPASTASRPSAPAWRWCAPSRSPSRPSRCAGRHHAHPPRAGEGRPPRGPARPLAAHCSTGSAWASTASRRAAARPRPRGRASAAPPARVRPAQRLAQLALGRLGRVSSLAVDLGPAACRRPPRRRCRTTHVDAHRQVDLVALAQPRPRPAAPRRGRSPRRPPPRASPRARLAPRAVPAPAAAATDRRRSADRRPAPPRSAGSAPARRRSTALRARCSSSPPRAVVGQAGQRGHVPGEGRCRGR